MRKSLLSLLILISTFIISTSCDLDKKYEENRKNLEKGMQERSITKVTQADFLYHTKEVVNALKKDCKEASIKTCLSQQDSLKLESEFISKNRLQNKMEDEISQQLLEAYSYSFENKEPLEDSYHLQKQAVIYFAPVSNDSTFLGLEKTVFPKALIINRINK